MRAAIKQLFPRGLAGANSSKVSARWGFTPQRPVKRAYEQRPEAVQKWLKDEYLAIVARAKAEGAEISWADETAASSVEHYARGYAPRGKTPVLVLSQSKRCRDQPDLGGHQPRNAAIHALSADAGRGHVFIKSFSSGCTSDAGKKVFLIVDNLRVHHAKVVTARWPNMPKRLSCFTCPATRLSSIRMST
ncbi:MAG: winged helix-turn-helix domain-containing protein [Rhodocyclaceae bacterium]